MPVASNLSVILGKRRFICLSPTVVRVEFAPAGAFEARRSMIAYPAQVPTAFKSITRDGDWDVLDTGAMTIRTCKNDIACNRLNLEIRWNDGKLVQFWRPEDRDHQNLGGTLRSLDRYSNEHCELDGVNVAGMESSDLVGTSWPAWFQCEVDPLYVPLHPAAPKTLHHGDWLRKCRESHNDGSEMDRTFNWYRESRKFCPGVLSRSGYYFLNDSLGAVLDSDDFPVERNTPGHQDWYFFAYGRAYKQALADFRLVSGPAPIPRHRSFGVFFSRWPAFTVQETTDIYNQFTANGYPLSTLVMDMEWHKEGWGHWEINPELIPDPKKFFELCRTRGIDVVFNDHPLDVRDDDIHYKDYVAKAGSAVEIRQREYNGKQVMMAKVDITDKQQNIAFREVCHTEFMRLGLDFWWNDGSRGNMITTCGQLVTNKSFFDESERDNRRGMLLGRYGGLGSHRYGSFFTGDASSDYHVLKLQCEFTIRAGGVGMSYISHDIGGFMLGSDKLEDNPAGEKIINPVQYLRWLQFGVFGPILRFHCAPGCGSRKPYDYDALVGGACRNWLRVRHSLLPYIYTAARCHNVTGVPMVRALFLEDAENEAAYRYDEYYFGAKMLVAPMLSEAAERPVYLPPGGWWAFQTNQFVTGGVEFQRPVKLDDVPVYVKAGSIIPRQSPDAPLHAAHCAELTLEVYTGADGTGDLYEDDGMTNDYKLNKFCQSAFKLAKSGDELDISGSITDGAPLGPTRTITLVIYSQKPILKARHSDSSPLPCRQLESGAWEIQVPASASNKPWKVHCTTSV